MRYKVKCEDRIYFDVFVEAESEKEAEEAVQHEVGRGRHHATLGLYDILNVTPVEPNDAGR